MRGTTRTVAVAVMSAAALLAAGCGSGDSDGGTSSEGKAGGEITIRGCNPENPLIPANTNEVNGGQVLNQLFAGLVYYKADGSWDYDAAESIEARARSTPSPRSSASACNASADRATSATW